MKKLLVVTMGIALLTLPMTVSAAVTGSSHDMTGAALDLCGACHVPHKALGASLWASTPSGIFTGVQDLCYTCHDGSVTTIGATTVMDPAKEQHIAVGTDCSGDGACHDVHTQNPNTTGKFITSIVTEANGNYCEPCHTAPVFSGAEGLGDHSAGIEHYTNGATFSCNQCHTIHGATAQTQAYPGLTNPILLADNNTATVYGAFCISCHNGTAPTGIIVGVGGVAATDVFDYSEATNDGSEFKHPTTSTTGANPVGGCNLCHDVHDPAGTATNYILMADNANSAYCVSCHAAAGAPGVGSNTHFTGIPADVSMNSGLTPAMPWANQINEDGVAGADYATATANMMVCESCHSVHRQGLATSNYFLREDNGTLNEVCSHCHTAN